jgi:acetolactate synthase-1/2/3 large subunit
MLNFQKVASAFDIPYINIQDYQEIDNKILEIISTKGPVFVEVVCDNNQKLIEPLKSI